MSSCYFVHFSLQFLIFCVVMTNINGRLQCFANKHNGTLGKQTNGSVSVSREDIYAFDYADNLLNDDQVCFTAIQLW